MSGAGRRLGPFAALGHRFTVDCDDAAVAACLEAAFATLAAEAGGAAAWAAGCYELRVDGDRASLRHDGELLADRASCAHAVALLAWHVNQAAVRSASADHLVLHAAALAHGGRALLLPAPTGGGKTTLAAGLVDRGWGYLSDEAAVLTLDGARVRAYPKPLSIDPGSRGVLPGWRPPAAGDLGALPESLRRGPWQVPVTARGGEVASEAEVAAIVLPRHAAGAATALTPLPRARAMARAAACVAGAWRDEQLASRFRALAAAVRRSACAELQSGDLGEACAALGRFWEQQGGGAVTGHWEEAGRARPPRSGRGRRHG